MSHRITQEVLQLTETQRLLLNVGIKDFDISRRLTGLMQQLPFIRVAEQIIAFMEIAGAERLQWMLLSDGLKQIFVDIMQSPTAGQMISQLANQYRRRAFTVIANAATDPADIELVTCRQQGFQQQIAVIFASGAVARAVITCLLYTSPSPRDS